MREISLGPFSRLLLPVVASFVLGLAEPTLAKPKVKVAVATKQKFERKVVYAARLEPHRRVRQQSLFQGKVKKHLVEPGAKVRRGQAIMTLERLTLGQDFSGYTVKSHISGRINDIFLDPGMEFATGAELFEILDLSKLVANFGISDKDRDTVEQGNVAVAFGEGFEVAGKVERLGFAADPATGLFPLEAHFPPQAPLRAGQFVKIQVGTRSFEGVTIPRLSVVQKFGKPHVFVVKKPGAVELRELQLGPDLGSMVGITGGIAEGEAFVLEASENLQDGVEVDVEDSGEQRRGRRG